LSQHDHQTAGNYQPIVALLRGIYSEQHQAILEEIIGKIHEDKTDDFPEHKRVMGKFTRSEDN